MSDCTGNPCNKGKCKVDDGKVKCSCGKNYLGEYCEIKGDCKFDNKNIQEFQGVTYGVRFVIGV